MMCYVIIPRRLPVGEVGIRWWAVCTYVQSIHIYVCVCDNFINNNTVICKAQSQQ